MSQADFLEQLRRRPFLSFRIVVSDGTTYDIHHPDQVISTFSSVRVNLPDIDLSDNRASVISLFHVVRLDPLPPATSVTSN